jgi:hypothetical protein
MSDMVSLGEMVRGGASSDMMDYRHYVIACAEVGKKPLPFDQWVKAGKPSG